MAREIDLVDGPDGVSREWLDGVLAGAGLAPAGGLEAFSAESIGTGKIGEIVRLSLRWRDGARGPASLIGKFASRDATSRQAGLLTGTYAREISFYRALAESVDLKLPACYGVAFDPEGGDFVLVLEDLSPASPGDQLRGCSVDQAAEAMRSLAGLHAPHYGNAALRKEPWLSVRSPDSAEGLADLYDMLVDGFATRFAERLDADTIDAALRLKGRVGAWLALDAEPFTLLHGDYRVENLLFAAPGADFALAVVDWQTVSIGPGSSDVAYFLGAGLSPQDRRAHEIQLVGVYRDAMAARGVHLDPERTWNEYRANAFAGLHMAVVASQLVGQDPRSDEMFCVMAERHAAQALELGSFEMLGGS